jgi:hypothetical protein
MSSGKSCHKRLALSRLLLTNDLRVPRTNGTAAVFRANNFLTVADQLLDTLAFLKSTTVIGWRR